MISYLDNVTLYQYTAGTGEAATSVPISLRDFLAALAIAVVTVALARNLPGLLEVLVLQRLTLAQGSAYATTTPAFLCHQRHRHRQRPVHPRGQLGQAAMAGGGAR